MDFLIITAHEDERDAVLSRLPDARRLEREGEEPHTYYEATVKPRRGNSAPYRVLVTQLLQQAPAAGAVKAQAATARWNPRYVLMVGAATGFPGRTQRGDVLIAQPLVDCTVGKRTPQGRITQWEALSADPVLIDAVHNLGPGWRSRVKTAPPDAREPQRKIGAVLSGGDVIEDAENLRTHKEIWDTLIGAEVAGGGVAQSLAATGSRPRFLMIRGVGEVPGEPLAPEVAQAWRAYACDAAAAYALELLLDGSIPLKPKPGCCKWGFALALGLGAVGLLLYAAAQAGSAPAPPQDPEPPSPPAAMAPQSSQEEAPPLPGDPTPMELLPAGAPAPAHASLPSAKPVRPRMSSPEPECQTVDLPLSDGELRVQCRCGDKPVRLSGSFAPAERALTLKRERWTCP